MTPPLPDLVVPTASHPARRIALLLVLVLVGVLVFTQPGADLPLQKFDKHLHLLAFTVITMITVWALPNARISMLLIGLMALSGLSELVQALPSVRREADWFDFVFNGIAICVTLGIVAAVRWITAR